VADSAGTSAVLIRISTAERCELLQILYAFYFKGAEMVVCHVVWTSHKNHVD
jgi:hypothetical protein